VHSETVRSMSVNGSREKGGGQGGAYRRKSQSGHRTSEMRDARPAQQKIGGDWAKCLWESIPQFLKNHELAALREGPLKERVAAE